MRKSSGKPPSGPELSREQQIALERAKALRADPQQYPRMLYRNAGGMLLTYTVSNPVEHKEAVEDGWREKP